MSSGRQPKPWSTRSDDCVWDTIVIGSGIGGMACAALLAKLGKRVLVLEQHYVPGGFTHTFKRPGYSWDVGVHAVGEVTTRSFPGRILHKLTDGNLQWASLGNTYDTFHFPDDFYIEFPDSPAQFRENVDRAFAGGGEVVDRYLAMVREVAVAMKSHYLSMIAPRPLQHLTTPLMGRKVRKYWDVTAEDVLRTLTDDPRLRAVLSAQWGYYGSTPSQSSFVIQALVAQHFKYGAFYPVGGSGSIARHLLQTVANSGGWTRISADVSEILVRGDRAYGVRLADGEEIRAKRVVSAAGIQSTVRRLLPASHRGQTWADEIDHLKPGPAHVCLYIGFRGDITQAGASAANKWFYETWDMEHDAWLIDADSDPATVEPPVLYCSFPSLKDPLHDPGPELRHTGEVVTFVPWKVFEPWANARWKKRGADYDALKHRLEKALLDRFLANMPDLAPMIDYVELSTPASTQHFCRPVDGSIYGLAPSPQRYRTAGLRPRAPIKNLYFAGAEVAALGVVGAMMGGVLAATAAEPIAGLRFVGPLMKSRRPS